MRPKQENHHLVDILFVISLFCVFAFSALMLVIIGADIYKKTVSHMNNNYAKRTSFAYITEKVRQYDKQGGISVIEYGNGPALSLEETIDQETYYTVFYQYDGQLRELFSARPEALSPGAGQAVFSCSSLELTQINSSLYQFSIIDAEGHYMCLYVSSHCN